MVRALGAKTQAPHVHAARGDKFPAPLERVDRSGVLILHRWAMCAVTNSRLSAAARRGGADPLSRREGAPATAE